MYTTSIVFFIYFVCIATVIAKIEIKYSCFRDAYRKWWRRNLIERSFIALFVIACTIYGSIKPQGEQYSLFGVQYSDFIVGPLCKQRSMAL